MRLVDDDEIPVGLLELRLHVIVTGELVEAGDDEVLLGEGVSASGRLDRVAGDDVELESELLGELVLPLLHEAPRRNDQAAADITPDHELLDEEPGHDGLARTRIVREQEAKRLAREHSP